MRISFDLDSVIFDIEPLYIQANQEFGVKYKKPLYWSVKECYPANVAERLIELFKSDILYQMPIISAEYPIILNNLLQNDKYQVYFVTQRRLHQPEKSFAQLRNAGINCRFDQVYDNPKPKVEVLKSINPDLHFDDSPNVVADCLHHGVNIAMISNQNTLYNHHLRPHVQYYSDLKTALIKTGILQR
ncbi:MAG: hypothetical protein K2M34_04845 [Alphaproteobacteria bacterium]|nr:hypothetical protein [Alphaproteobacteria bacterium]